MERAPPVGGCFRQCLRGRERIGRNRYRYTRGPRDPKKTRDPKIRSHGLPPARRGRVARGRAARGRTARDGGGRAGEGGRWPGRHRPGRADAIDRERRCRRGWWRGCGQYGIGRGEGDSLGRTALSCSRAAPCGRWSTPPTRRWRWSGRGRPTPGRRERNYGGSPEHGGQQGPLAHQARYARYDARLPKPVPRTRVWARGDRMVPMALPRAWQWEQEVPAHAAAFDV